MQKNILFRTTMVLFAGIISFASCDDYLNEIPDNRTELDTPEKVTKLLVSAYAISTPTILHELMSDNMSDRGKQYGVSYTMFDEAYRMKEISGEAQDAPYTIWEANYAAITAANGALEAIEKLSDNYNLSTQKGEALLCRAYAHFTLCNAFCQAYNTQSSDQDLGIPYVYEVETTAINAYERGTVEEVYEKINEDIEAGLRLIDDNLYTQPKYHFNKRAAYAFAARFNLFYGNYDKAIEYATVALGDNPSSMLRDYTNYGNYTSTTEYTNAWVSSEVNANIMLQGQQSLGGRMYTGRYVVTYAKATETLHSSGPWESFGGSLIFSVYVYHVQYTSYMFPKQMEYFVYTDQVAGIGHPYLMLAPFTTEKTLLDRAEAYTLKGEYDKAAADLSYVYEGSGAMAISTSNISVFYSTASSLYRKPINPRFTVNSGMQTNFVHACLHMRRILTVHEGDRFLDIKRYGIRYEHEIDGESSIVIEPFDKRLAIQIPALVIAAGMQENPR